MKKNIRKLTCCMTVLSSFFILSEEMRPSLQKTEVKEFLHKIITYSAQYSKEVGTKTFKEYANGQSPHVTILLCSDSRVQLSKMIDETVGDFFVVRNIGNQYSTSPGSVDFGVLYLKTPIVIVLGHSNCGAVNAALKGTSLSPSVKKEVDTIAINTQLQLNDNIVLHVNNQVNTLLARYKNQIDNKELTIIGAVYDFANAFGRGYGSLILTNINGETNSNALKNNPYLQNTNPILMDE